MVTDILELYTAAPVALGANNGLNNFVPLGTDLNDTPNDLACFLLENIFDTVPGQVAPVLLDNLELFEGFVNGIITPFFSASFGCPALPSFAAPGSNAGTDPGSSVSAAGSPINGVYPPQS
jgi:hypothetical protein